MDNQKAERYRTRYYEEDFQEFVQQLIDGKHLDGAALGIAKQIVDKGIDSLTEKQRYVFERDALDHYYVIECDNCGEDIPWSEMYFAEDTSMCAHCEHKTDRMMQE